jgi:WS/DGAT/MGAT family acyltransferase
MNRLQSQVLDRRRPLWELWFVEGLAGDRVAIIQKTHHALVDGISGVDVATVLLDLEPDPEPVDAPAWQPESTPPSAQLLAETLFERATEPAEMARTMRAQLRGPRRLVETAAQVGRAVTAVGGTAPKMPWNVPVSPHRRFEVARVDLERAKAVKNAAGCTLNDVVLAAVTGALRSFLEARGEAVDDVVLRAMCPVSVRTDDERMTLGNRVSAMIVALPVGEPDPRRRLELLAAETAETKSSGQALGVEAIMSLSDYAAPTLLSIGARLASATRPVNLGITNVPGPPIPLYCMGAKMLEAFPYVGIIDNQALMVGVLSYGGQLGFGITGDRDVLSDLHLLAEGVEKGFTDLAEAVGA